MLENWFNTDITLVTTTRNNYGDLTYSAQTTVKGLILNHSAIQLSDRKEQEMTDSICWLPKGTTVTTDTLLKTDDTFRIIKIVKAKRAGSNTVEFVKCYLQSAGQIAGIS